VNGQSIGEFGQLALCAAEMGVPAFFASGDLALTKEAEALTPGIVTCAVKRGVTSGIGEECALKEYQHRNAGAIHTPPVAARTMIRQAAEAAAWKLKNNPPKPVEFKGPYEAVVRWRPEEPGKPRRISRTTHKDSFIGLMNTPMDLKPEV
jgi:D-aminopeptidase